MNPILKSILENQKRKNDTLKKEMPHIESDDEDIFNLKEEINLIINEKPKISKVRSFFKEYITILEDEYSEESF